VIKSATHPNQRSKPCRIDSFERECSLRRPWIFETAAAAGGSGGKLMLCAGAGLFMLLPPAMATGALHFTGLAAVSRSVAQDVGNQDFEASLKALRRVML